MTQTLHPRPALERPAADPGPRRIPVSTWRRFCEHLRLSPEQAAEVWEEIVRPLAAAADPRPDLAWILRLRAARPQVDIHTFKAELAPIRHLLSFFDQLADPCLGQSAPLQTGVLRFYAFAAEHHFRRAPFSCFAEQFAWDLCRAFLVAKIAHMPGITLDRLLSLIAAERADLDRLAGLLRDPGAELDAFLRGQGESARTLMALFPDLLRRLYGEAAGEPVARALRAFDPLSAALAHPGKAQKQVRKASAPAAVQGALSAVEAGAEPFAEAARRVGRLLARAEQLDPRLWKIFLDPAAPIPDLYLLAQELESNEGPVYKVLHCLRQATRYLPFKEEIPAPIRRLARPAPLAEDVKTFLRHVGRERTEAVPDERKVLPLRRILDHCAGALLRLEVLRLAGKEAKGGEAAVLCSAEDLLSQLSPLADADLLERVREHARADAQVLCEHLAEKRSAA